jgi:hypothetical protein
MENATCRSCRWWWAIHGYGECRRYPPQVMPPNSTRLVHGDRFPRTEPLQWCGEHRWLVEPAPEIAP